MDPPFTDDEKRFLLAEALKTTRIPVERILALINEAGAQPVWQQMVFPFGRNMSSCLQAYGTLQQSSSPLIADLATPVISVSNKRKSGLQNFDLSTGNPPAKRRQSGGEGVTQARNIQPKPASNGSPQSFSPLASGQQPKKRGRPSKADIEARHAEAIARGEVLPPLKLAPKKEKKDVAIRGPETMAQSSQRPLAPNLPGQEDSMVGEGVEQGIEQLRGRAFEQAPGSGVSYSPRMVMGPAASFEPASKTVDDKADTESTTSSKKNRVRPASKATKGPKTGEGSFHNVHQEFVQFEMPSMPAQHPPAETGETITVRTQAELLPSQPAFAPQPRLPQEAPPSAPVVDASRSTI